METPGLRGFIFLKFILINYYHYGVRSCKVTVEQETFHETYVSWRTANLSCQYKATDCSTSTKIYWFRYLATDYEKLYPKSTNRFKVYNHFEKTFLQISNITVQDSGIYLCGIAFIDSSSSTSKTTGPGTTLLIRNAPQGMITPTNTSLIVICTLLFIYSITVFPYYAFKSKWKIWKLIENKHGSTKQTDKSYRARSIFQAIAQEYHNRYDQKTKKQSQVIEDDTIYQNT